MAALAPLNATPARQPFGVLDRSHLRSLQSVKNRQNALTPSSGPSLKRRYASPEISDSENVDPNKFDFMSKRKRTAIEDDVSVSKSSRYSLTTISSSRLSAQSTPRLASIVKPTTAPASAPAAAGRSPTHGKRHGILSRKRLAPPSFGLHSPSLSLSAALKGTLAHKKAKKTRTLEESKPKSWFFDIFEESQEVQDYRINEWTMTESATILDISDDESKTKEHADRGKENVDPNELSVPVTRSMAAVKASVSKVLRKDMMTDDVRSPLGDLNPTEYFAEGLDATSVVLVHDDSEEPVQNTAVVVEPVTKEEPLDVTFQATTTTPSDEKLSTAEIGALLMASAPVWDTQTLIEPDVAETVAADCGTIDFWESGSAKDENEAKIDESIFALQEI